METNILISFGGYGVFFVLGMIFMLIPIIAGRFVRPINPSKGKEAVYECGEPTIGSSWIRYNIRFYATALDFLIFDVEVVLLLPIAIVLRPIAAELGPAIAMSAFLCATVFIAILALGLAYAWRHGTIEWVMTDDDEREPARAPFVEAPETADQAA
jgi:NADH-quinone oxidoreductase subunit A